MNTSTYTVIVNNYMTFQGNVLKEIVEPAGAIINTNAFTKGDSALTTLELWVAEYQVSMNFHEILTIHK